MPIVAIIIAETLHTSFCKRGFHRENICEGTLVAIAKILGPFIHIRCYRDYEIKFLLANDSPFFVPVVSL